MIHDGYPTPTLPCDVPVDSPCAPLSASRRSSQYRCSCAQISHHIYLLSYLTRSHPISHPHTSTLYLDLWISGVSRSLLYNNLNSVGDPSMSIQTAATTMNDTMSFWHLEPSRWSEPEIYFTAASFNHHNYRAILIHSSSNKCNSLKAKEKVSH